MEQPWKGDTMKIGKYRIVNDNEMRLKMLDAQEILEINIDLLAKIQDNKEFNKRCGAIIENCVAQIKVGLSKEIRNELLSVANKLKGS